MQIGILFFSALMLFIKSNQSAQELEQDGLEGENKYELPIRMDPDSVKYLRELIDDDFQATLQKEVLKNAKWKRLINQKKMAVGVVDLWVQKPRPLSIQNRKL